MCEGIIYQLGCDQTVGCPLLPNKTQTVFPEDVGRGLRKNKEIKKCCERVQEESMMCKMSICYVKIMPPSMTMVCPVM